MLRLNAPCGGIRENEAGNGVVPMVSGGCDKVCHGGAVGTVFGVWSESDLWMQYAYFKLLEIISSLFFWRALFLRKSYQQLKRR